jgi:hypothetical protein
MTLPESSPPSRGALAAGDQDLSDAEFAELDALLAATVSRARVREAARCECGAPLFWGAKFCGQCGQAVPAA